MSALRPVKTAACSAILLAAAPAGAAPVSPIFGTGPHQNKTRLLSPDLTPVASSPRFRDTTSQIEQSPDGTQYAAAFTSTGRRFGSYLGIYDAATGKRTARLRINLGNRVLSWLTDDRIAVVKRGKPTTVRIVSVSARKVIHREVLRERLGDTARVGDRQVTLTGVKTGDEQTLRVFNADGTLERAAPLPGIDYGSIHSRAPNGKAVVLANDRPLAYEVDITTGDVVRHDLDVPRGALGWVEPQGGDLLAVDAYGAKHTVSILDPATFAVSRRVVAHGLLLGAGDGFASYDTEGEAPLIVYGPDGEERWRVPHLDALDVAAFGDRLYAGSGYDDVNIRIFDLATGELLRVLPGRAVLFEATAGRVLAPYFTTDAITED